MKGFVITNKYLENIASLEIEEIANLKKNNNKKIFDSIIIFEINSYKELALISYKSQSINRVAFLLCEFNVNNIEKIKEEILKNEKEILKIKDLILGKSFKVECERKGEHDFKSTDIEINIGKVLYDLLKKNNISNKIDYDHPEIIFYVFINQDKGYFGLDFSGFDLSKRTYKIFNHPESLKGTIAYSLVRLSGFNNKLSLLDPFMGSGTIVIEAAIYASNIPVQYYNRNKLPFFYLLDEKDISKKSKNNKKINIYGSDSQMRYLKATQKNSKLAGVDKILNLGRIDLDWLDTKFKKNSINLIVTDPPRFSKNKPIKEFEKLYDEFFYQSDFILKNKGKISLLAKDDTLFLKASEKHNFKIVNKYLINQGMESFFVLDFEKKQR